MAKKIFIGFVALVLVAFVLLFQFGGRAAEELTKKLLAEQTALQGTLKAEEIQANWSGDVIFKNVVWVERGRARRRVSARKGGAAP